MNPVPRLDEIVARVRADAAARQRTADVASLEQRARAGAAQRRPLRRALERAPFTVIAELKRTSPSAKELRRELDPAELARAYEAAGAAALSVVTCGPWFCGSLADLTAARAAVALPILCKDFLVTPFQIVEAAAAGADAVLLIAAALDDAGLLALGLVAHELGLAVLHEAHDAGEVARLLDAGADVVGVNSRDLATMAVDPAGALALGPRLPCEVCGVFESGVKRGDDLRAAARAGYRAALVGETLLRAADPGARLRELLRDGGVA